MLLLHLKKNKDYKNVKRDYTEDNINKKSKFDGDQSFV